MSEPKRHLCHPHTDARGTYLCNILYTVTSPRIAKPWAPRHSPLLQYPSRIAAAVHRSSSSSSSSSYPILLPFYRRTDAFRDRGEEGSERARSQGFGGGGGYRLSIARDGGAQRLCVGVRVCECSSGATRRRRSARALERTRHTSHRRRRPTAAATDADADYDDYGGDYDYGGYDDGENPAPQWDDVYYASRTTDTRLILEGFAIIFVKTVFFFLSHTHTPKHTPTHTHTPTHKYT